MQERILMKLNIFSFFSGTGFLDLGFEKEQFNITFVNEYSQAFLDSYKHSRKIIGIKTPEHGYYCGDINELLKGEEKIKLTKNIVEAKKNSLVGFIGGPPCPDFSIAGKNKGITGLSGKLINSYKKLIISQLPDFFVFENVKGLWSTRKHRDEYNKLKKSFTRKGYIFIDKLVNSIEYGVPQYRERVILFGIKYDLINSDMNIARKILKLQFQWGNNEKYDFLHLMRCNWPTTTIFVENRFLAQPDNIIPELTVEYWFNKNDVYNHPNSNDYFLPRSMDRFNSIEEGDVSKKSFKRLHRWRYSPTVAYGNNEVHLHPYKSRRLTVAEALAIQSLPKQFEIPATLSRSEMFKTVGNGVPYLLARTLAKQIRIFMEENAKRR